MKIIIDGEFYIDVEDKYNYILHQIKDGKDKNGSTIKKDYVEGYFTNPISAIKKIIHIKDTEDFEMPLYEYIERISNLYQVLYTKFKEECQKKMK